MEQSSGCLDIALLGAYREQEKRLRRQRMFFYAAALSFVVVSSFFYGLVKGIRNAATAHAYLPPMPAGHGGPQYAGSGNLELPRGVLVMQVGSRSSINGTPAQVYSFVSKRKVRSIIEEQVTKWQARGLTAFALGKGRGGVAVALHPGSGERHILNVWRVPGGMRRAASAGMPVQGMLTSSYGGEGMPGGQEKQGIVPGVPLYPGGSAGAVFAAQEGARQSYSGLYRAPVGVPENVLFYREEMIRQGWSERGAEVIERATGAVGHLLFERDGEELTILFSPASPLRGAGAAHGAASVALVSLGPKQYQPPL